MQIYCPCSEFIPNCRSRYHHAGRHSSVVGVQGSYCRPRRQEATVPVTAVRQEATKISKRHDKCATKKAILRLRAGLRWPPGPEQLPKTCLQVGRGLVCRI
jgi:hypothetical protein